MVANVLAEDARDSVVLLLVLRLTGQLVECIVSMREQRRTALFDLTDDGDECLTPTVIVSAREILEVQPHGELQRFRSLDKRLSRCPCTAHAFVIATTDESNELIVNICMCVSIGLIHL